MKVKELMWHNAIWLKYLKNTACSFSKSKLVWRSDLANWLVYSNTNESGESRMNRTKNCLESSWMQMIMWHPLKICLTDRSIHSSESSESSSDPEWIVSEPSGPLQRWTQGVVVDSEIRNGIEMKPTAQKMPVYGFRCHEKWLKKFFRKKGMAP